MERRVSPRRAIEKWLKESDIATTHGPTPSGDHCLKLPSRDHIDAESIGIAAKLDLHPPFQRIEAKGRERDREQTASGTRKRRRQSCSDTSSVTHTSSFPKHSKDRKKEENDHRQRSGHDTRKDAIPDQPNSENGSDYSSSILPTSTDHDMEPIYKRRPRRKTREDKYELKQGGKVRARAKKEGKPSDKKRKRHMRKEKTGAAILQSFSAKNVASERLTLKASKVGLFTKGRASSPQRREGLPDLFSEVKFLEPKRHGQGSNDNSIPQPDPARTRRKKKAVDVDEEIFRFFTDTKPSSHKRDKTRLASSAPKPNKRVTVESTTTKRRHDVLDTSSSVPASELPGRPFLGFGEPGPQHDSASQVDVPLRHDTSAQAFARRSSASIPTSRVSWSESPASHQISLWQRRASSKDNNTKAGLEVAARLESRSLDMQGDEVHDGRCNNIRDHGENLPHQRDSAEVDLPKSPSSPFPLRVNDQTALDGHQTKYEHPFEHDRSKPKENDTNPILENSIIPGLEDAFKRLDPHDRSRMRTELSSLANKWSHQTKVGSSQQSDKDSVTAFKQRSGTQQEQCCDGADWMPPARDDPTQYHNDRKDSLNCEFQRPTSSYFRSTYMEVPSAETPFHSVHEHTDSRGRDDDIHETAYPQASRPQLAGIRRSDQYNLRASIWDSPLNLYESQMRSSRNTATATSAPRSRSTATPASTSKTSLPFHVYGTPLPSLISPECSRARCPPSYARLKVREHDRVHEASGVSDFAQNSHNSCNDSNTIMSDPAEEITRQYPPHDDYYSPYIMQSAGVSPGYGRDHHSTRVQMAPDRYQANNKPLEDLEGALSIPAHELEDDADNLSNPNDILPGFWKPNKLY